MEETDRVLAANKILSSIVDPKNENAQNKDAFDMAQSLLLLDIALSLRAISERM